MTNNNNNGVLFSSELQEQIRNRFCNVDSDSFGSRIFFENSGGSLRLRSCVEKAIEVDAHPDCGGRPQKQAKIQENYVKQGYNDLYTMLGTSKGSIITCISATQVMFDIINAITGSISGKNIVVSSLEHPSAFDSVQYYANLHNLELRILQSNPSTGSIENSEVERLVDENTVLLSCMYASNVTGAVNDIPSIAKIARNIKPSIYIVIDAVQHMPHDIVDIDALDIDALNFAPYKYFGLRGSGIGWVSPRCAILPHNRILGFSKETWELGSTAPHIFANFSEIFNHVAWIGEKFTKSKNRRELFINGMKQIKLHERALLFHALEGVGGLPGLREINGVRVHCDSLPLSKRHFVLPITFDNIDSYSAVKEYINRGIHVFERKSSDYYSNRIIRSLGLNSLIRISPIHCNSLNEIYKFLQVSQEIARL